MTPAENVAVPAAGAAGEHPSASALLCPSCGSPVATGERFCEACGADLDGPPAVAAPTAAAPPPASSPAAAREAAGTAARTTSTRRADVVNGSFSRSRTTAEAIRPAYLSSP